jgi:hypothetical protein
VLHLATLGMNEDHNFRTKGSFQIAPPSSTYTQKYHLNLFHARYTMFFVFVTTWRVEQQQCTALLNSRARNWHRAIKLATWIR